MHHRDGRPAGRFGHLSRLGAFGLHEPASRRHRAEEVVRLLRRRCAPGRSGADSGFRTAGTSSRRTRGSRFQEDSVRIASDRDALERGPRDDDGARGESRAGRYATTPRTRSSSVRPFAGRRQRAKGGPCTRSPCSLRAGTRPTGTGSRVPYSPRISEIAILRRRACF